MPPERNDLNDPAIWIDYAKSDLALARHGRGPEIRLGALCFHCQQAAEKALKAILLKQKVEFPPTHSIKVLLDLLPSPLSPTPEIIEAAQLSNYAIKGRYPLDFVDVQPDEYEKALKLADGVLRWAEKALK
jgi:HEPN domain-containing protein